MAGAVKVVGFAVAFEKDPAGLDHWTAGLKLPVPDTRALKVWVPLGRRLGLVGVRLTPVIVGAGALVPPPPPPPEHARRRKVVMETRMEFREVFMLFLSTHTGPPRAKREAEGVVYKSVCKSGLRA